MTGSGFGFQRQSQDKYSHTNRTPKGRSVSFQWLQSPVRGTLRPNWSNKREGGFLRFPADIRSTLKPLARQCLKRGKAVREDLLGDVGGDQRSPRARSLSTAGQSDS